MNPSVVEAAPRSVIHDVDAATASRWLAAGEAVLIDVRESREHAAEHIAQARLMPLSAFDARAVEAPAGRRLVVHCKGGMRSRQACAMLGQAGAAEVWNLVGGIDAWRAAGLPVVRNAAARSGLAADVMRQTQLTIGVLLLAATVLAAFVTPWALAFTAFIACGLMLAGLTGLCPLATLVARMPWNHSVAATGRQTASPRDPAPCCGPRAEAG